MKPGTFVKWTSRTSINPFWPLPVADVPQAVSGHIYPGDIAIVVATLERHGDYDWVLVLTSRNLMGWMFRYDWLEPVTLNWVQRATKRVIG